MLIFYHYIIGYIIQYMLLVSIYIHLGCTFIHIFIYFNKVLYMTIKNNSQEYY